MLHFHDLLIDITNEFLVVFLILKIFLSKLLKRCTFSVMLSSNSLNLEIKKRKEKKIRVSLMKERESEGVGRKGKERERDLLLMFNSINILTQLRLHTISIERSRQIDVKLHFFVHSQGGSWKRRFGDKVLSPHLPGDGVDGAILKFKRRRER